MAHRGAIRRTAGVADVTSDRILENFVDHLEIRNFSIRVLAGELESISQVGPVSSSGRGDAEAAQRNTHW